MPCVCVEYTRENHGKIENTIKLGLNSSSFTSANNFNIASLSKQTLNLNRVQSYFQFYRDAPTCIQHKHMEIYGIPVSPVLSFPFWKVGAKGKTKLIRKLQDPGV